MVGVIGQRLERDEHLQQVRAVVVGADEPPARPPPTSGHAREPPRAKARSASSFASGSGCPARKASTSIRPFNASAAAECAATQYPQPFSALTAIAMTCCSTGVRRLCRAQTDYDGHPNIAKDGRRWLDHHHRQTRGRGYALVCASVGIGPEPRAARISSGSGTPWHAPCAE